MGEPEKRSSMTSTAVDLPDLRPLCARHPAHGAVRACERCGQYVCADCVTRGGLCLDCIHRSVAAVPSSAIRARRTVLFLRLSAGLAAGHLLISLWLVLVPGAFESLKTWGNVSFLSKVLVGLSLFIHPGTLLLFLLWLHRFVRQLHAWGIDAGVTPGWAVGWWFVPLANLIMPLRIVRSALVGLGGASFAASLHVRVWWGAFLLSRMMERVARYLSLGPRNTPLPPMRVTFVIVAAGSLCTIAAALLAVRIIRSAQERLDARRKGLD